MTRHDPERSAAAFMAGDMSRREGESFEHHLLECEPCWREVHLGEIGRYVAESGREIAPPHLRERVRAAVELAPGRRRSLPGRPMALMVLAAVAVLTVTAMPGQRAPQPEQIQALLADFGGAATLPRAAPPKLPVRLGGLRLVSAEAGSAGGRDVTAHRYRDPAGHRVAVYRADRAFPVAAGAEPHPGSSAWEARTGNLTLFCATRPFHALVVGDDEHEVKLAVRALGLR